METPGQNSPSPAHPQHPSWMAGQRFAERDQMPPHPTAPWTACGCSSKAQAGSRNGCRTFLPSSWAAPLGIVHSYKQALLASQWGPGFPAGLLWVTGLQNSLNKTPGRDCTRSHRLCLAFLRQRSPALQTPHGRFSFTHRGQAWHLTPPSPLGSPAARSPSRIPTGPAPFYLPRDPRELPSGSAETARPVPGVGGGRRPPQGMRRGELPAPRRGNEPRNYGKRAIHREASLAPAWLRARRVSGPPSPEPADLGWEILRDAGRGAGMEVARQL